MCAEELGLPRLALNPVQKRIATNRLPEHRCRDPLAVFQMQLLAQQAQQHAVLSWLVRVPLEARTLEPLREVGLAIGRINLDRRFGERQPKQCKTLLKAVQGRVV